MLCKNFLCKNVPNSLPKLFMQKEGLKIKFLSKSYAFFAKIGDFSKNAKVKFCI